MPIQIAVCDDEQKDIELLSAALLAYDPSFEIVSYSTGETLVDDLQDCGPCVDILFLDIYMPGLNGIETAQKIHKRYPDLKMIFLSSSKDYYSQAFEVFAFNYMLKPLNRDRLYAVLDRAVAEVGKEQCRKLRIQYKSATYNVSCRDIQYIESRNKLLFIHLVNAEILQCYGKLDEMIKELPEQFFIRCHQSFVVNTRYVTGMGENSFRIGPVVIGISKKYLKPSKDQYYSYLFSQMGGRSED